MLEQTLGQMGKELPEELTKRMSLNRFFAMQRDIVNDELESLVPDLIEDALENPTGSYQIVTKEQTRKLDQINKSNDEILTELGEIKKLLGKVGAGGAGGAEGGLLGNLLDMLGVGGALGLGAKAAFGGKKSKNLPKQTKLQKGLKFAKTGGRIGLGLAAASYLFGDKLTGIDPGQIAKDLGYESLGDNIDSVGAIGGNALLYGASAAAMIKAKNKPTISTATQTASNYGNVIKDERLKGTKYYTQDPTTGKTKFISMAEGAAAEKAGNVSYKGGATAADKIGTKSKSKIAAAVSKIVGPKVAKIVAKAVPGVGLLTGIGFGAMRAMQGDFKGAAAEVGGGAASLLPGVGTAASIATDVGLLGRDVYYEAYDGVYPEDDPLSGERLGEVKDSIMEYISSYMPDNKNETATPVTNQADLPAINAAESSGRVETQTPSTPLTMAMSSLANLGGGEMAAGGAATSGLIGGLMANKSKLSDFAQIGMDKAKGLGGNLLNLAMGGGAVTGDKLKQLGVISPDASPEEVDAAVKEYSDISKSAGPVLTPQQIANETGTSQTAIQNMFAPTARTVSETTIDNNPNAEFQKMIEQMMTNFQAQNTGDVNKINAPAMSTSSMPKFIDLQTPVSMAITALRSQGLADVYSHHQAGSTIERSNRGGETTYI